MANTNNSASDTTVNNAEGPLIMYGIPGIIILITGVPAILILLYRNCTMKRHHVLPRFEPVIVTRSHLGEIERVIA
jgi:hypothetical protein